MQVVRNASSDPIKYLMKYFNIKADEGNLSDVERLGEEIARLEGAVDDYANARPASLAHSTLLSSS